MLMGYYHAHVLLPCSCVSASALQPWYTLLGVLLLMVSSDAED